MFKKGQVLRLTVIEDGTETEHFNCKVEAYEDGLLKIRQFSDKPVVYNVRSSSFVKAQEQD